VAVQVPEQAAHGRRVAVAPRRLITTVDARRYTVAVSLDIQNAFNTV